MAGATSSSTTSSSTYAQVHVGKFKLPFSLDENTSSTNLDFAYRSLAATVPGARPRPRRQVHGRVAKRILRYELGVFEHDGRNARTNDIDARHRRDRRSPDALRVEPFRRSKSLARELEVGAAFTGSDVEEGIPGTCAAGRCSTPRSSGPITWSAAGGSAAASKRSGGRARSRVKSEWIRVSDERLGAERRGHQSVADHLDRLVCQRHVGDHRREESRPASTRQSGRCSGGGFGAVEVAARVERLEFTSDAAGQAPSTSPRADAILGNARSRADVRRQLVPEPLGEGAGQHHPRVDRQPGAGPAAVAADLLEPRPPVPAEHLR